MAILSDFGKTLAETGQTVVSKTKDLAGITVLNTKVSDLQRKNDKLCKTIGKLYLEHYGDNPEEPFKGVVEAIHENQKQIAAYKEEIKRLKGVKICASCGTDVKGNEPYCPKCGAKIEDEEVVADVEAEVTGEEEIHAEEETAAEADAEEPTDEEEK